MNILANMFRAVLIICLNAVFIYYTWHWNGFSEWTGLPEMPWAIATGCSAIMALMLPLFDSEDKK